MTSQTSRPHRNRRFASVVAAFSLLTLAVVLVRDAQAAPYPLTPYGDTTGTPVCDTNGEQSPPSSDVACNTTDNASSYIGADSSTATFGFVLGEDPRDSGNPGPLKSTAYVVAIAVDGTQVATVGLDGKRTGGTDVAYMKCFGNAAFTYSYLVTDGLADGRVEVFAEPGSPPYYRLQFQLPYAHLQTCGVTPTTSIQLFYGTSQAANLDVINKDHFRGDTVDFTGLAVINFSGTINATKTATVVSGANPPVAGSTTRYDLAITVRNDTPFAMRDVVLTDTMPTGVEIVSVSVPEGNAAHDGTSLTWDGFSLAVGEIRTMTVRVDATPASANIGSAMLLNPGASVTATRSADGATVNATSPAVSSATVRGAVMAIAKTVSPPAVNVGETVTYTVTVTNSGDADGAITSVTDTLPAGISYVAGTTGGTLGAAEPDVDGQTLTWTGGSVPFGASRTVTFDAVVEVPGLLLNTAAVTGTHFAQATTGPTAEVDSNGPPVAVDDDVAVQRNGSVTASVMNNDSSPDGDPIDVSSVTQPAHGTVTNNGDGTVTYTPDTGYTGPDSFTYEVCDPDGACATGNVSVTVYGPTDPPVVLDDDAVTDEDVAVDIDVLNNDVDPQGDDLFVDSVSTPAHGTASVNGDGTITYTPAAGYEGADAFTYIACTSFDRCAEGTVDVDVLHVNHAPTAADDTATTDEGQSVTIDVLANDDDPDGDALVVAIIDAPQHGTAVVASDGSIDYTPDAGSGNDTFTYQACDPSGACATAEVTVTVNAAPPVVTPTPEPTVEPTPEPTQAPTPTPVVQGAGQVEPTPTPSVEATQEPAEPTEAPGTPAPADPTDEPRPADPSQDPRWTVDVDLKPAPGSSVTTVHGPRLLPHTGANVLKLAALSVFLVAAGLAMLSTKRDLSVAPANADA